MQRSKMQMQMQMQVVRWAKIEGSKKGVEPGQTNNVNWGVKNKTKIE